LRTQPRIKASRSFGDEVLHFLAMREQNKVLDAHLRQSLRDMEASLVAFRVQRHMLEALPHISAPVELRFD
jgi:hypothetical protein